MCAYDNNLGSIAIPENSDFSSLNSNCGKIIVGRECKISECKNNSGLIKFGRGLCIRNIINNSGQIIIDNDSKVDLISGNSGSITLASDCVLLNTTNNSGSIVGAKNNFNSGNCQFSNNETYSYRYNPRNVFCSTTVITDGERSSSDEETVRTIFNNVNVGSVRGRIFNLINYQGSSSSSSSESNSPDRHIENYSFPTAPVLEDPIAPVLEGADEKLCVICMDGPKNVAFQCGHLCCSNCSEKLISCHICRVKINQKIKLFL